MDDQSPVSDPAQDPLRRHPNITGIEDVIVYKLARFAAINERLGARWSETLFGISINEWRLIGLIEAYQPARAGDLSQMMLMDKSQLSRLIQSLTAKNHIKAQPDTEDRRALALTLTHQGDALYRDVIAEVLRRNERVLEALSPEEVAQFDSLLDRLIHHNHRLLVTK